jgi:hypothetical protein
VAECRNLFVETEKLAALISGVAPRMRAHPTAAPIPQVRSATEPRRLRGRARFEPVFRSLRPGQSRLWPPLRKQGLRGLKESAMQRLFTGRMGVPHQALLCAPRELSG